MRKSQKSRRVFVGSFETEHKLRCVGGGHSHSHMQDVLIVRDLKAL